MLKAHNAGDLIEILLNPNNQAAVTTKYPVKWIILSFNSSGLSSCIVEVEATEPTNTNNVTATAGKRYFNLSTDIH